MPPNLLPFLSPGFCRCFLSAKHPQCLVRQSYVFLGAQDKRFIEGVHHSRNCDDCGIVASRAEAEVWNRNWVLLVDFVRHNLPDDFPVQRLESTADTLQRTSLFECGALVVSWSAKSQKTFSARILAENFARSAEICIQKLFNRLRLSHDDWLSYCPD